MKAWRRFVRRLTSWMRRQQDEQRLQAEIEQHLAFQTEANLRAGLPPEEARRQAVLKFGALEAMRENYRDQRGFPALETFVQDTRYVLRRLRNAPAFTTTTVLMLALGIGATTSIFTLVYAVLLKPLAVANPDELYRLGKEPRCCYQSGYTQEKEFSLVSYDLYKYFRDNTNGFSELAAFSVIEPLFGVRRAGKADPAQSYPGEYVSGNYFTMFGIHAYAGRAFTESDDRPNAAPVAVMSYRLWQQRYRSDPSVIGGAFDIDQKPFTVIGITPPGFFGDQVSFPLSDGARGSSPDFFLPLNTEPYVEADADLHEHNLHWFDLIGRIRRGVKPASTEAEMRVALKQWLRLHWGEMTPEERAKFPEQTLFLTPGGAGIAALRGQYDRWLRILMAASGFVLLIVCANLANLMLVRGMERRQQISLSMALGAQASRLVRQALTESVLLSLLGGMMGLAVAFTGTRLILHFAFSKISGVPIDASPSIPVLLFAFGVSVATGIAFGIAPAWMATRVDPMEALRGASRATTRPGSLPRKVLVVFQAALSLVLLSAAGLFTAALHNLENQNVGFDVDRRVVIDIEPRLAGYGYQQLTPLCRRIHDTLSSIPGVAGVTLSNYMPQDVCFWGGYVWLDGRPANNSNVACWDRVTAGYFDVIGNPVIRGRGITDEDTAASRHVGVVNEAFARKFFKNEDPLGKHFGREGIGSERQYEIVGVAKNIRNLTYSLDRPTEPFYFLPEAQHDFPPGTESGEVSPGSHFLHNIVIATKPGATLSDARLRRAMASVDPNLPVISIQSLNDQIAGQFRQQRLTARLSSFFGVLSLALASIGLYGVTAYNAGLRTTEIGVRMAIGADRGQVVALVLRGAFMLIALGLVIGLPLTFAAGKFLGNQLYGMSPYNSSVTLLAVATLGLSALIAAVIPALRATSISPIEALRVE